MEAQFPDAKSVLSDIVDVPSPLDDVAPVKTEDDSYVMVFSTSTFAQIPQQKEKKRATTTATTITTKARRTRRRRKRRRGTETTTARRRKKKTSADDWHYHHSHL